MPNFEQRMSQARFNTVVVRIFEFDMDEVYCIQYLNLNLDRSKTYEEVRTAQGRTNSIINSDKLFLAAMKWSPVVDGKFITVITRFLVLEAIALFRNNH